MHRCLELRAGSFLMQIYFWPALVLRSAASPGRRPSLATVASFLSASGWHGAGSKDRCSCLPARRISAKRAPVQTARAGGSGELSEQKVGFGP